MGERDLAQIASILQLCEDTDSILVVAHGALLRAMHFCIIGYNDDTDFHGQDVRFENCEMRKYKV